jgi:hypothetical protein
MRVRHKPTTVDAVRWDGSAEALQQLLALGLDVYRFEPTVGDSTVTLVIPTAEGDRPALPGDVVIKGTQDEFYPVKPDVYEACYEPAVDDAWVPCGVPS